MGVGRSWWPWLPLATPWGCHWLNKNKGTVEYNKNKARETISLTHTHNSQSGSDVIIKGLTFAMTDRCDRASRMLNQTPMFWARSATGRRYSHTNLWASRRTSTQLLRRAKSGAKGNAATKMVMKPNWSTAAQEVIKWSVITVYFRTCDPMSFTNSILAHLQVFLKQAFTFHQLIVFLPAPRLTGSFIIPQHLGQRPLLLPGLHFTVKDKEQALRRQIALYPTQFFISFRFFNLLPSHLYHLQQVKPQTTHTNRNIKAACSHISTTNHLWKPKHKTTTLPISNQL